ncbi:hypothetical protein GIV68_05990 [Pseudomonas salomonii]|uniref:Transposase n=1 Tax=Pseudomonas salomonii TaxID=191391 RepID=A0ABS9GEQ8_9PSED|nr:hypothetical protein [Pseudomonas salomonii]
MPRARPKEAPLIQSPDRKPNPHSVNRSANRLNVLVHDGFGIWLAARQLNQGKFH